MGPHPPFPGAPARRRAARAACALLALCGCRAVSSWDASGLSGSAMAVTPANLPQAAAGAGSVEIWLYVGAAGSAPVGGALAVLHAGACEVTGSPQAIGADGVARFTLTQCPVGVTDLTADIRVGTLSLPVAVASSVRVYSPADGAAAVAPGDALNAQVTVTRGDGKLDLAYRGTAHFTASDPQATLPDDVSFGPAGVGSIVLRDALILRTPGTQIVRVIDVATSRVLTTLTYVVAAAAAGQPATVVLTAAAPTTTAGAPLAITLEVQDAGHRRLDGFVGTALVISSDPDAQLPAPVIFTAADAGRRTVDGLVLHRAGAQVVSAAVAGLSSAPLAVQVSAAPASRAALDVPAAVTAGRPFTLTLIPRDAYGNDVAFADPLVITAGDQNASVGAVTPLAGGSTGSLAATCVLRSLGTQSLTVTDAGAQTVWGSAAIEVFAADPVAYRIVLPSQAAAGDAIAAQIFSQDAYGNPAASQSPQLHLISSDAAAVLPAPFGLGYSDNGSVAVPLQLRTAATPQTVGVATDSGLVLAQAGMRVDNGAATQVAMVAQEVAVRVGVATQVRISVYDAFANLVQVGGPTLSLSSSDGAAVLPSPRPLASSDAGVVELAVQFGTAGTQQLVAHFAAGPAVAAPLQVVVNAIDAVGLGLTQTCALLRDHSVHCFGTNAAGELGLGDTVTRAPATAAADVPAPAIDFGGGRTAVAMAGGASSACAVLDDGGVRCWGNNDHGQLGVGDTLTRGDRPATLPSTYGNVDLGTHAPGVPRRATAVAMAYASACALLDDGAVKCWGGNLNGGLGLGDTTPRGSAPGQLGDALPTVDLGTGRTARQLVALRSPFDGDTFYAVLDDGTVKAWGQGRYGVRGSSNQNNAGDQPGTMGDALAPVDLGTGVTATQLATGTTHVCALLGDGRVKCWGTNNDGCLGVIGAPYFVGENGGQMGDALAAVDLGTGRTAQQIAVGDSHSCAVLDDGTMKCWGSNNGGQLGLGDTTARGSAANSMGDSLPALQLGTGQHATQIAAAALRSCALLQDGHVKCWGVLPGIANLLGPYPGAQSGSMGDALAPLRYW